MIKRLPQFAEHHFATLCASAGVVCNASDQDECGWDFFVQYAEKISRSLIDLRAPGPEALVQVKSTRSAPLVARMKLSNALRAAQAGQPHFVVLVVPGSDGVGVYARHFWKPEITRTLRRVRLAQKAGDETFNRRHFDLRMDEADRHDHDLLDWMRTTIESVKPDYAGTKSHIVGSAGHEDGFGTMNMTIEGDAEDFLNLALGLVDSLPLTRGRFTSKRFGIEIPRPELDLKDGTLSIMAEGKPAKVRLQGGSPTEEITADATLYCAELPDKNGPHFRWRLDAGPLRIVGGGGKHSSKLSMRYKDQARLSDVDLFLTMLTWRGAGPVGLQIFLGDKRIPMGSLTLDIGEPKDEPDWKALRHANEAMRAVARAASVEEPEVSIIDLDEAGVWLERFAGFVLSPVFRVDYEPQGIDDPTRAAIYYVGCDVGEWCFLAVIERNMVRDEMVGKKRQVIFGSPRLLDAVVRRGAWRELSSEIEAAYHAQIGRLGDPGTLWELGELEAFVAKATREAA